MTDYTSLLSRIEAFGARRGLTPATVVRNATGNARLYARLHRRFAMMERDAARIAQWMDDEERKGAAQNDRGAA